MKPGDLAHLAHSYLHCPLKYPGLLCICNKLRACIRAVSALQWMGKKLWTLLLDCNVNIIYTWKLQHNLEMSTKVWIWLISHTKSDYFPWIDDVLEFYLRGYKKTMSIYEKH